LNVYGSQVPFTATPIFSISPPLEYYLTSIEIKRAGYIKAFEFFAVSSGSATLKVSKKQNPVKIVKQNVRILNIF
jgi:hypothetical protein